MLVSTDWLAGHLEDPDLVVVDMRWREDGSGRSGYERAHIPGAVNLPYTDRIKPPVNLPRTKTLLLYCPCQNEEESTEMAIQLEKLGYRKLKLLQGGFPKWRELKYPTAKSGE